MSGHGLPRGVQQAENDRCSAIARKWAASTWPDSSDDGLSKSGFAHLVPSLARGVAVTSDGIGTKVEIAERIRRYETLGFDLVAMVVDDLAAGGARPSAITNILDVDRFDETTVDALMRGLAAAARAADVVVAGGEIAQLGERICGYGEGIHLNWCATALGDPLPVPARALREGDTLIAFASDGFRSNGFTLVRQILTTQFGPKWHAARAASGKTWGEILLTPSRIYAPAVLALRDAGVPLLACVHVTGGGLPGNLPRVFEGSELRADLAALPAPHEAMEELIELGGIRPKDAYEHWNMGTGFICIVPPEFGDQAVKLASAQRIRAYAAGTLTAGEGVTIDARGWNMGRLTFEAES